VHLKSLILFVDADHDVEEEEDEMKKYIFAYVRKLED
jgi:hypothetical protein